MRLRQCLSVCAIALFASLSPLAQAATAALPTDGSWTEILMDNGLDPYTDGWVRLNDDGVSYTPLSFTFTIANGFQGRLTVVDTGFAGDRIAVHDIRTRQSAFSSTPVVDDGLLREVVDADAALADLAFGRTVLMLAAGQHWVTGGLQDGGVYGATSAAIKLEVSAVPEPATVLSLLAGLGLIGATLRRRAR